MHAIARRGRAGGRELRIAGTFAFGLAANISSSVFAQTQSDTAVGSINLGARGGVVGGAPTRTTVPDSPESPFEFSARGGFATDYIMSGWCSATYVAKFWFALN